MGWPVIGSLAPRLKKASPGGMFSEMLTLMVGSLGVHGGGKTGLSALNALMYRVA